MREREGEGKKERKMGGGGERKKERNIFLFTIYSIANIEFIVVC